MTLSNSQELSSFSTPSPQTPILSLSSSLSSVPSSLSSLSDSSSPEVWGQESAEMNGAGEVTKSAPTILPSSGKSFTGHLKQNVKRNSYKHVPHCLKPAHLVAKRNARERTRVQAVNSAFGKLRKHVPYEAKHKRLSKVKTLRLAIEYIHHLQEILESHDQRATGRYSSCSGLSVTESPESSRARRRAKISDSRFCSSTRTFDTGVAPHSCNSAVFRHSASSGGTAHSIPPLGSCSEETTYGSNCSTVMGLGECPDLLEITSSTTAGVGGNPSCSQSHVASEHCIDACSPLDIHDNSIPNLTITPECRHHLNNSKNRAKSEGTDLYQMTVQKSCVHENSTLMASTRALQVCSLSGYQPMYHTTQTSTGVYQYRDICSRQIETEENPRTFCGNIRLRSPQTSSAGLASFHGLNNDKTNSQNFLFTSCGHSSSLMSCHK